MSSYTNNLPAPRVSTSLAERIDYAKHLAQAGLLPSAYRGRPANVLLAIETGDMLGIAPMAAITNIHVIEGKPTFSAGLMAALVRRAGHRFRVTGDGSRAVASVFRADDPEFEFRAEWTLQRAVDAGLVRLKDGKPFARDKEGRPLPWERYTAALLKARATSEVCRDGAQDVFLGPVYVPEELGADVDADGDPLDQSTDQATEPVDAELVTTEHRPQEQEATTATAPAPAPVRSDEDWEAERAQLVAAGDVDGLRNLHAAAKLAGANPGLLHRIAVDGRELKQRQEAGNGPATAADTEDQDAAVEQCVGVGYDPDGDVTLTGNDGTERGVCPGCLTWQPVDPQGYIALHVRDDGNQGDTTEAGER